MKKIIKQDVLHKVKIVMDSVVNVFKLYEERDIINAHQKMDELFEKVFLNIPYGHCNLVHDTFLTKTQHKNSFGNICEKPNMRFFRARVSKNGESFSKEEMFHIPENKRAYIGESRYSLNGIPALYMGSSSLVCWNELGNPELSNLEIISLKIIKDDFKMFNMATTFGQFCALIRMILLERQKNGKNTRYEFVLDELLIALPMQIASSFKSLKSEGVVFRVEYIIPKIISQTLYKSGIDGIIYLSNKMEHIVLKHNYMPEMLYTNYVLFTRNKKKSFCDRLLERIEVSEPINFKKNNIPLEEISKLTKFPDNKSFCYTNRLIKYSETEFFEKDNYWFIKENQGANVYKKIINNRLFKEDVER